MHKLLFIPFSLFTVIFVSGCHSTDGYYGGHYGTVAYGGGPGYYSDSYPYRYGGYRGYRRHYDGDYHHHHHSDDIYVDGHSYRYDDDDRLYYTRDGRRVYMTDAQYARNRQAINEYRARAKVAENRQELEYARNKQKIEAYRQEQEWKQRQARANYEQKEKQYEYQQKVAANRAKAQQNANRAELEQKKREWEWKQKQNEAKNRAAIAKWKAENGSSEKKKKKKD